MILNKNLEQALRGSYRSSFFHIYLDGVFDMDLSRMSVNDQGTFVHEYVHYLQNIGTLWGIGSSTFFYRLMIETKVKLQHETAIHVPHDIDIPHGMESLNDKYANGVGTSNFANFYGRTIDINQDLDIHENVQDGLKNVSIDVHFTDGTSETISLGSQIVKESMAALYQSLIDPNAKHPDIPYNFVQKLCEQKYPRLANNVRLLICACFTSLFSMCPGITLLSLLDFTTNYDITDGMQLFDYFIQTHKVIINRRETDLKSGLNIMIDRFKNLLNANLASELDYIAEALERVKLTTRYIPILTILYDNYHGTLVEKFQDIINYYGVPYIQSNNGIHYPKSADQKKQSDDVLELQAQEAVFVFIATNPLVCPLNYMCMNSRYTKDECYFDPWNGNQCSFTIAAPYLQGKQRI